MELVSAGDEAWTGAAAFLAVLAYPQIGGNSDARKDRFVVAVHDWFYGWERRRVGMRRVTIGRAQQSINPWITNKPSIKNEKIFERLNAAEEIISVRRRACALAALNVITKEKSLSSERDEISEDLSIDQRTMRRYWQESLPVLHLAIAFFLSIPAPQPGGRQGYVVRSVMCRDEWLAYALQQAEGPVLRDLVHVRGFDPSRRIRLIAK